MLSAEDREDLLLACRYGDLEDVEAFVKQHGQASLSGIADDNGNTIIHMVAANGHIGTSTNDPKKQLSMGN